MRTLITLLRRPEGRSRLWLVRDQGVRLEEEALDAGPIERLARFDLERDVDALVALWRDTLPAPDGWPRTPPPAGRPIPAPPRPTAANPRAFRGTKRQPPKAARPRVDLRPFLDRAASVRAAGVALEPDPYLEAHHPGGDAGDLDGLPPRFRAWVLPSLRGAPWPEVERARGRWEAIVGAWPDAGVELAAVAAAGGARLWDAVLARLSTGGRALLGALAAQPSLADLELPPLEEALHRIEARLERRSEGLSGLVSLLARGASPAYAASGVALAARCPHPSAWDFEAAPVGQVDAAFLADVFDLDGEYVGNVLARAWFALGARPDLEPLLRATLDLPPAHRAEWGSVLSALACYPDARWRELSPALAQVVADGRVHPQSAWRLTSDPRVATSARALALLPLVGDRDPDVALALLLVGGEPVADASVLDAIDAAVSSDAKAACVLRGLEALGAVASPWTRAILRAHPAALLRLARRLGLLSAARAAQIAGDAIRDPSFDSPATEAQWTEALAAPRRRDPFSRALRDHADGRLQLRPGQLVRHRARARARWWLAQLDAIEDGLDRALYGAAGAPDDEAVAHAAALLARAGRHRRGLRRMLQAALRGDREWVERHPASRAWYARHPSLDVAAWREGVRRREDVPGHGALTLAFERDPLEVLRLGTYVGSCLGLGAGFADDAAGVALDVNKRVVYARDAAGQVVARQLVAFSETRTLVCLPVYPTGASEALQAAFARFDRELAARLSVDLEVDRGDEPDVAAVLSFQVWLDPVWDLEPISRDVDGEAAGARAGRRGARARSGSE